MGQASRSQDRLNEGAPGSLFGVIIRQNQPVRGQSGLPRIVSWLDRQDQQQQQQRRRHAVRIGRTEAERDHRVSRGQ